MLKWQTATELNNDYFDIQRSHDGVNWSSLDRIEGAGNSSEERDYNWIDYSPLTGVSYYRLKQVDFDGTYEFSPIRSVFTENIHELFVYPNPASDVISVRVPKHDSNELIVRDITGRIVYSRILNVSDTELIIPVQRFAKGVFFIQLGNYSQKFIKD